MDPLRVVLQYELTESDWSHGLAELCALFPEDVTLFQVLSRWAGPDPERYAADAVLDVLRVANTAPETWIRLAKVPAQILRRVDVGRTLATAFFVTQDRPSLQEKLGISRQNKFKPYEDVLEVADPELTFDFPTTCALWNDMKELQPHVARFHSKFISEKGSISVMQAILDNAAARGAVHCLKDIKTNFLWYDPTFADAMSRVTQHSFHIAASHGNVEFAKELCLPPFHMSNPEVLLNAVIISGDVNFLLWFWVCFEIDLSVIPSLGDTCLSFLVENMSMEMLEYLYQKYPAFFANEEAVFKVFSSIVCPMAYTPMVDFFKQYLHCSAPADKDASLYKYQGDDHFIRFKALFPNYLNEKITFLSQPCLSSAVLAELGDLSDPVCIKTVVANGNMEICNILLSKYSYDQETLNEVFLMACKFDPRPIYEHHKLTFTREQLLAHIEDFPLDVIIWVHEIFVLTLDEAQDLLNWAMSLDNGDLVIWIVETFNLTDIAEYVISTSNINVWKWFTSLNAISNMNNFFTEVVSAGNAPFARWLVSHFDIDHDVLSVALFIAVQQDKFDVSVIPGYISEDWIRTLTVTQIQLIFTRVCRYLRFDLAFRLIPACMFTNLNEVLYVLVRSGFVAAAMFVARMMPPPFDDFIQIARDNNFVELEVLLTELQRK